MFTFCCRRISKSPQTLNTCGDRLQNLAMTTFAVAPVELGKEQLKCSALKDCAQKIQNMWKAAADAEGMPREGKSVTDLPEFLPLEFETGLVNHEKLVKTNGKNGFIETVLTAYNQHKRLILTPDDWWLVIAFQVSKFISQPDVAEKYRKTFVSHEGKMDLAVNGGPLGITPKSPKGNKEGWPLFVDQICELIDAETKENVKNVLMKGFTTTGKVENAAFGVVLMESMKQYFTYKCILGCGIPEISLEGTEADYASILDRIDCLKRMIPDFNWYLNRVRLHMEKVYESKIGKAAAHRDWWRTMVTAEQEGSGGQVAYYRWLSDFFAYGSGGGANQGSGADLDDFDAPMVTLTDVQLVDGLYTMKTYHMKFAAGIYGCTIDEKDENAVRPSIGWGTFYWKEGPL